MVHLQQLWPRRLQVAGSHCSRCGAVVFPERLPPRVHRLRHHERVLSEQQQACVHLCLDLRLCEVYRNLHARSTRSRSLCVDGLVLQRPLRGGPRAIDGTALTACNHSAMPLWTRLRAHTCMHAPAAAATRQLHPATPPDAPRCKSIHCPLVSRLSSRCCDAASGRRR